MKFRSILFALVVCALLCSPAALWALERSNRIDIPSWLSTEDAAYLSGGRTNADVAAVASTQGFLSGKLQQALEDEIGNYIPAKATALLTNAKLQYGAISASNLFFNWKCLPTFYGSTLAAVPSEHRLVDLAQVATDDLLASAEATAASLSNFCEQHPDINLTVYLGPDSQNVDGSPTGSLMSNPLSYDDIEDIMEKQQGTFKWVSGAVSYDEFLQNWYNTDHHWNIRGAFQAYQRIATALGFGDKLLVPTSELVFDEPIFLGSFARRGLNADYSDAIIDYVFEEFPDFSVKINGEKAPARSLAHEKDYREDTWNENAYANRYAEYFHTDYASITLTNKDEDAAGELLIVGDSYSNCMERFLASHYKKTYVLDPRHTSRTLDSFLASHENVKDVVFIMRSTNLLSQATRDFIEGSKQ